MGRLTNLRTKLAIYGPWGTFDNAMHIPGTYGATPLLPQGPEGAWLMSQGGGPLRDRRSTFQRLLGDEQRRAAIAKANARARAAARRNASQPKAKVPRPAIDPWSTIDPKSIPVQRARATAGAPPPAAPLEVPPQIPPAAPQKIPPRIPQAAAQTPKSAPAAQAATQAATQPSGPGGIPWGWLIGGALIGQLLNGMGRRRDDEGYYPPRRAPVMMMYG